jgi:hypothetical protein
MNRANTLTRASVVVFAPRLTLVCMHRQRREKRGDLPESPRFGLRTVRHRLENILAFARGNGLSVHVPQPLGFILRRLGRRD